MAIQSASSPLASLPPVDHLPMALSVEGAGGAGKTTLADRALQDPLLRDRIAKHVTSTNRPPRAHERDGVDYWFRTDEEMRAGMEDFLSGGREWIEMALVHGIHKGSKRADLEAVQATGKSPVIVQDYQGARTYRRAGVPLYRVHILPPSAEALVERLTARKSETGQTLTEKLSAASTEIRLAGEADYILVNKDLEAAYEEFSEVVKTVSLGQRPMMTPIEHTRRDLLATTLATDIEHMVQRRLDYAAVLDPMTPAAPIVRVGGVVPDGRARTMG